jgi:hypothetical protein
MSVGEEEEKIPEVQQPVENGTPKTTKTETTEPTLPTKPLPTPPTKAQNDLKKSSRAMPVKNIRKRPTREKVANDDAPAVYSKDYAWIPKHSDCYRSVPKGKFYGDRIAETWAEAYHHVRHGGRIFFLTHPSFTNKYFYTRNTGVEDSGIWYRGNNLDVNKYLKTNATYVTGFVTKATSIRRLEKAGFTVIPFRVTESYIRAVNKDSDRLTDALRDLRAIQALIDTELVTTAVDLGCKAYEFVTQQENERVEVPKPSPSPPTAEASDSTDTTETGDAEFGGTPEPALDNASAPASVSSE